VRTTHSVFGGEKLSRNNTIARGTGLGNSTINCIELSGAAPGYVYMIKVGSDL